MTLEDRLPPPIVEKWKRLGSLPLARISWGRGPENHPGTVLIMQSPSQGCPLKTADGDGVWLGHCGKQVGDPRRIEELAPRAHSSTPVVTHPSQFEVKYSSNCVVFIAVSPGTQGHRLATSVFSL